MAEEETFLFSYDVTRFTTKLAKALNRERSNVGRSAYADRVKDILSQFKVVGVIETNMGLGSVSSGGSLYAEVCAALYESHKRPLVVSFMAGMGGEAIVLKEFYWMTQKMIDAQKRGTIEKRTHWVGFEE